MRGFLKIRKVLMLAAAVAVCAGIESNTGGAYADDSMYEGISIGALLPLTGSLSSYGETSLAALEDAAATFEAQTGRSVALYVEDTSSDPAIALTKLVALRRHGVRVVIGPYSSSEVRAALPYANAEGILLLSPLSTATSLALPDDNLLRFTPDDAQEAVAMAALAWADGHRTILPITRDDVGNQGLQTAMKASFEKLGGRFLTPIVYSPSQTDFASVVASAETAMQSAPADTAIYLTAFDEVTSLFAAASSSQTLRSARWLGSDSVALSKGLIEARSAAAFAVAAGYPNPILGLPDTTEVLWGPVSDRLALRLGRQPDAFALAAFDALIVAAHSLDDTGPSVQVGTLRNEITQAAASYTGLTGSLRLNAAGDRALGNYDFWSVCSQGGSFVWYRAGSFLAPDVVKHTGCPR